eukprot:GSMAST32.ASY1.ANO1.1356.1 assembled CDS
MKKQQLRLFITSGVIACTFLLQGLLASTSTVDEDLEIVIVRHGEKPENGDNLSCQGQNRALQLPAILHGKIGVPDYIYVPSLKLGEETKHSRMFQTVTPFAIKYNLKINTIFGEKQTAKIAKDLKKKTGTALLVWEHSEIHDIAKSLGIEHPPKWHGKDFDSIWIITLKNGEASLNIEKEGINPSAQCN